MSVESPKPKTKQGLSRHFEGWQIGAILIGIGVLSGLLAIPRAVAPEQLPLPHISESDLRDDLREHHALAAAARQQGLSFEARTVGEYLRKLGNAEHKSRGLPAAGLADRLNDLRSSVAGFRRARGQTADRELSRLRAVQGELFVLALRGRGPAPDLTELGGAFDNAPGHASWFDAERFVGDDVEALLLFKVRWNHVTQLDDAPDFALRPNEWLALVRFLLQHPEGNDVGAQAHSQLATLDALGKRQPEYPLAFAQGTVFYRQGAYDVAALAFEQHLEAHPSGPWSLRARNHLLAARERGSSGQAALATDALTQR
ncbi:MAG: hypothetical protein H6718_09100 [Polyangiaceae bacterium]|nr:hypothetical protein [Myxococcales bacterium]MCB9585543.1 hypothetical protein [Polyangiaceae bacterium]MCB9606441.1 hypothetical protein [Polyangiaceae bacterium]